MMMRLDASLFLLLALLATTTPVPADARSSYRAAVAQYTSSSAGSTAAEVLDSNLARYDVVTAKAAAEGAQIVVFPEWGLFGDSGTSSRDAIRPFCELVSQNASSSPTVARLVASSVAAGGVVVVANVCDKVPCAEGEECPFGDGVHLYNTEVAVDDTGVLAVYHKYHPWKVKVFDKPPLEVVSFSSSFGVQFGLFVCFDIVWPSPQSELMEMGVRHFPYSVALGSVEFISSTTFRLWSAAQRPAALLASNLGAVGSGVFVNGSVLDAAPSTSADYVLVDVPV